MLLLRRVVKLADLCDVALLLEGCDDVPDCGGDGADRGEKLAMLTFMCAVPSASIRTLSLLALLVRDEDEDELADADGSGGIGLLRFVDGSFIAVRQ